MALCALAYIQMKQFKTKKSAKIFLIALLSLVVFVGIAGPSMVPAQAGAVVQAIGKTMEDIAIGAVTTILTAYVNLVGSLMISLITISMSVFQYSKFVDAKVVAIGWSLVRDIVNMFFVIALLIMAFYTVLGRDEYGARKMLVKLIIVAVAINFSRTVCGLLIDFSQVVMLTFVNGFLAVAGGNFAGAFNMTAIMQNPGGIVDGSAMLASYILAAIMTTVLFFCILTMLAVLIIRIVVLWVLIILSPLAWICVALPGSQFKGKYGEWWQHFINYNIAGPILAFFVWLTLYYMNYLNSNIETEGFGKLGQGNLGDKASMQFSAAAREDVFFGFIVATMMLMLGVQMAAKTGVVGASFAQDATNWMKKGAANLGKRVGKGAGGLALRGAGQATAGARLKVGDFLTKVPLLRGAGAAMIRSTQKGISEREDREKKKLQGLNFGQLQRFEKTALTAEGRTAARKAQMDDFFGIRKHLTGEDLSKDMPDEEKKRVKDQRLMEWKGKLREESGFAKKRNDGAALGKIAGLKRDNPLLYDLADEDDKKGFSAAISRANFTDLEKIDPTQLTPELIEAMGDAGRKNIMNRGSEALKEKVRQFEGVVAARPADTLVRDLASGEMEGKELRPQDLRADPRGQLARRLLDDDMEGARKDVMKVPDLRQAFMSGLENAHATATDPAEKRLIAENQVVFGGSAKLQTSYNFNPATGNFADAASATNFASSLRGDNGGKMFLNIADAVNKGGAGGALAGTAASAFNFHDLADVASGAKTKEQKSALETLLDRVVTDGDAAPDGSDARVKADRVRASRVFKDYLKGGGGGKGSAGGGGAPSPLTPPPISGGGAGGASSGAREIDLGPGGPPIDIDTSGRPPRGGGTPPPAPSSSSTSGGTGGGRGASPASAGGKKAARIINPEAQKAIDKEWEETLKQAEAGLAAKGGGNAAASSPASAPSAPAENTRSKVTTSTLTSRLGGFAENIDQMREDEEVKLRPVNTSNKKLQEEIEKQRENIKQWKADLGAFRKSLGGLIRKGEDMTDEELSIFRDQYIKDKEMQLRVYEEELAKRKK